MSRHLVQRIAAAVPLLLAVGMLAALLVVPATAQASGGGGYLYSSFGLGDWNGDGHADVVARNNTTGDLWLYPGSGGGGFGVRVHSPKPLCG